MLKFALEIACRGAENHVEKFGKSRGKVEEIAKRSSRNRMEKCQHFQERSYAVTQLRSYFYCRRSFIF